MLSCQRQFFLSFNLMENRAGHPIICVITLSTGGIHSILWDAVDRQCIVILLWHILQFSTTSRVKWAWAFLAKGIALVALFVVPEWTTSLREIPRPTQWRKPYCLWEVIQRIWGRRWEESSLKAVKQSTSPKTWVNMLGHQHAAFNLYLSTQMSGLRTQLFSAWTIFMFIKGKGVPRQSAYHDHRVFCAG